MELALDILIDAVRDTLVLVPFLFVTYLVLEALEHMAGARVNAAIRRAGAAGPAIGALLGVVPQCGFSAMGATLYAGRVVTLGTLVAVFLSTSDEMLPLLVAEQVSPVTMASILVSKALVGLMAGIAIDGALRVLRSRPRVHAAVRRGILGRAAASPLVEELAEAGEGADHIHELCERAHCGCEDGETRGRGVDGVCGCEDGEARGHEGDGVCGCMDGTCGCGCDAEDARDACACEHAGCCCDDAPASHDRDGVHDIVAGHEHHSHVCTCCGHELSGDASDGHAHAYESTGDAPDERAHEHSLHAHGHDHVHGHDHAHTHTHTHTHATGAGMARSVLHGALVHTVQVTAFIFLVTLVLAGVLDTIGEEALASFLSSNTVVATFASGLVGLIPNCAASVVITQLYLEGALALGPMMAGSLVAAGAGFLVLFRTNANARENVAILVLLYIISVVFGLIIGALAL